MINAPPPFCCMSWLLKFARHNAELSVSKGGLKMVKIRLVGWEKHPIQIEVLEVHVGMENHVYLRMFDKDGKKYETGLLKETS